MSTQTDEDEPVWGAEAIGAVIGLTVRQTWHLLSIGALPARKVGGRYVATRGRLRAYLRGDAPRTNAA
jgi:hypothetical protein